MTPAVAIALTGADQLVYTGPGIYAGLVLRETDGAGGASVQVRDGTSNTGTLIDVVSVDAYGSATSGASVRFSVGLYVEVVTGTVEGSVRLA